MSKEFHTLVDKGGIGFLGSHDRIVLYLHIVHHISRIDDMIGTLVVKCHESLLQHIGPAMHVTHHQEMMLCGIRIKSGECVPVTLIHVSYRRTVRLHPIDQLGTYPVFILRGRLQTVHPDGEVLQGGSLLRGYHLTIDLVLSVAVVIILGHTSAPWFPQFHPGEGLDGILENYGHTILREFLQIRACLQPLLSLGSR